MRSIGVPPVATNQATSTALPIVFAALAVSDWLEHQTSWSMNKFIRTLRRHRTVEIRAGQHTLTAADSLPDDIRLALTKISRHGAH